MIGIPAQLKKFNERLDAIEALQAQLQRVIDEEVLPAIKTATAKADAALEEASKLVAPKKAK